VERLNTDWTGFEFEDKNIGFRKRVLDEQTLHAEYPDEGV
jgi:hypothetical protein